MGCLRLLVLVLVLNFAHGLEAEASAAEETQLISRNVTGVLGDSVYLRCAYLGENKILRAEWKRVFSKIKFKRVAGFSDGKPFGREDFSKPASPTNLTVKMMVSSVDVEGEYKCEFESDEESLIGSAFVRVLVKPDVQIWVNEETINDTHYQSVSCSAIGGRPTAQISWLSGGLPPADKLFSVSEIETSHPNGTSTLSSILHFATRLQDEDSVTCVVHHPALPNPKLTTVKVETYARPNVTVKAERTQHGGNDFWEVSCISSGGRPDTGISLASKIPEELQEETDKDSDTQKLFVRLPVMDYEGQSITCVFHHPKFTHVESRVVTLPVFYLSGVQIHSEWIHSSDFQGTKYVKLNEGERDVVIGFEITGNVPRYQVICKKDGESLSDAVLLDTISFKLPGPVELQHAGLYECNFSYQHLNTSLRFNLTVQPEASQPVPPSVRVDLWREDGRRVIECVAADAVPPANVSWLLPEDVSPDFWFNSTVSSENNSVRGVLLLPVCLPRELTAVCVINHSAFEEPEKKKVILTLCAQPNISISAHTSWENGRRFTAARCSILSIASAASISWYSENSSISSETETESLAGGLMSTQSSVLLLSSLHAGQNLTCVVKHPSLQTPERRTVHIPALKAPGLSVSVARQQDSAFWLAVCDCRGEAAGTNLVWVLPGNIRAETSLQSEYEERMMKTSLIYSFVLAKHEGQDLSCEYQAEEKVVEKKTLHIPEYYISSVNVLNKTTPLQSRYGDEPVIHRVSVQENHPNQKILLRVDGNVPEYELTCRRSDGSFVQMDGAAMILRPRKGIDLYTCWASFYHHTASVDIQVESIRENEEPVLAVMICLPSAFAVLLVLVVVLCVCCKRNTKAQYKNHLNQQRESVSALTSLMQDPGSPEVKKQAAACQCSKDFPHISFSIVYDVKSTV